jgi:hypothetical protein
MQEPHDGREVPVNGLTAFGTVSHRFTVSLLKRWGPKGSQ